MHFEWMNNFIILNATGNHSAASNVSTIVNLVSSFDPVPNITLDFANTLNHEIDSLLVLTNCKLHYNNQTYQIAGKFERAQNYCNADYIINGSQGIISNILYKYSVSKPLTEISGRMSWFQEEVYIKYQHEPHRADFILTTPFKYIEQNAFNYYYDFQHYRSYFTTEVQLLQESFYFRSFVNHPNVHTIDGTVDISSTFLPKLSVLLEHQFLGEMVEKFKIIYGKKEQCVLDFEFSSDRSRYIGLNLEIPNYVWKTRLEKDFSEDYKNWFALYAWNNDTLLGTFQIQEDATHKQYVLDVSGSLMEHKTQIDYENNDEVVQIAFNSSYQNMNTLDAYFDYNKGTGLSKTAVSLKTGTNIYEIISRNEYNLKNYKHLTTFKYNEWTDKLEASYLLQDHQLQNLMLKWHRPSSKNIDGGDKSIQLLYKLNANEPTLSIVDNKYNESIEINGKFLHSSEILVVLLTVESTNFNPIELELNYNLEQDIKTSELIAKWDNEVFKLYADAALNSSLIMGNAVIDLTGKEKARVNFLLNKESDIHISTTLNEDQKYDLYTKYQLEQNTILLDININTPIEYFRHAAGTFDIHYEAGKSHANIKLAKDTKLLDFSSSITNINETYGASVRLQDSFFNLPHIDIALEALGYTNLTVVSLWKYNDKEASFNVEFQYLEKKLKFITDINALSKTHVDIYYDLTNDLNTFGLNLALTDNYLDLNGAYNTSIINKDVLVNIESKYLNHHEKLVLHLQGTGLDFMHIRLKRQDSIFSLGSNIHKDTNNILYNFTMKTPIADWEDIKGKIYINQENNTYKAGLVGEINDDTISLNVEVNRKNTTLCNVEITFNSFLKDYESIHAGFIYDLTSATKLMSIYLSGKEVHGLDVILDSSTSGQIVISFNAASPILNLKTINIMTLYKFDVAERFVKSIFDLKNVDDVLIDDDLFSVEVKTGDKVCESCFISIKAQQFANKTHHIALTTNFMNKVNDLSIYYTSDDVVLVVLDIKAYLYANVYLKAVYSPGLLNTSVQLNETDLHVLLNFGAAFTKNPILRINSNTKDYIVVQIGPSSSYIKAFTGNNYVANLSYNLKSHIYFITFNASRNEANLIDLNSTMTLMHGNRYILNYRINNTITTSTYQNLQGVVSWWYVPKGNHFIKYTISNSEKNLINLEGSINNVTETGFTIEYLIQTHYKPLQQNVLKIRFYPANLDVSGKLLFKAHNSEKSVQGEMKISPNGDQGIIKMGYMQEYVHFDWIFNADNIEAGLDTSHPSVRDIKLMLNRKVETEVRSYLFHSSWSNAIIESKLNLFIKKNDYERGRIVFQLLTPFPTISLMDFDVRYHMLQSVNVDAIINKKTYNFKMEFIQEENALQANIILNSLKPYNEIFKVSGKLNHVKIEDTSGSLVIFLFNDYICKSKYQVNILNDTGNINFMLMVQNVRFNIKGDYDVTDSNDKRINLTLEIPRRIYKLKSNISRREGLLAITDYYKMQLQNKWSILWYSKKNFEEQQIGVEFSVNKEKSTCMISLRPSFYGMKTRVLFDIRKVKNVIESEWNMDPGNEYITLSSNFMNNELILNSDMKREQSTYYINLNFEMPLNNVKNITFKNVLSFDDDLMFDGVLIWQIHNRFDNVTLKAEIIPSPNNFSALLSMQTPVTDPLIFKLNYDVNTSTKSFIANIKSKGSSLIMVSGVMNSTNLQGNLESYIDKLSNFSIIASQQNYKTFYVKYSTNKQVTELFVDTDKNYEGSVNVKSIYGEGPNVNAFYKVDQKQFKASAITHWSTKSSLSLELHIKPDEMHLSVETPKIINIDASINIINKEMYSLSINGYWNEDNINVLGSMQIMDNIPNMMLLNIQLGQFLYNMNSIITKTNDLLDITFGVQSSVEALDGITFNLRVDETEVESITITLIVDVPLRKEWKTELYAQIHNGISNKMFRIFGACMQQMVTISSSLLTEPAFGKYESHTVIDIPILFQNTITVNIDLLDRSLKPVSCKILLKYINTYKLEAVLNVQENKLYVTIKNDALLTDLLLDLHGSYSKNKLDFQVAIIDDVINGSYILKDKLLSFNLYTKLPGWHFISSTSVNANLDVSNDKLFMELLSETNNYKYDHIINYWTNSGKLLIEVKARGLDNIKLRHYILEAILKGPEYSARYEASSKNMIHFKLNEKLNHIYFLYTNKLLFDINVENDKANLFIKYGASRHNCTYAKNSDIHQIQIESPILPAKVATIEVVARTLPKDSTFKINLDSGKVNLDGHLILETTEKGKTFLLGIALNRLNISQVSRYEVVGDGYKFESEVHVLNKTTKFVFINTSNRDAVVDLLVASDYLADKEFALGAARQDAKFVAYIRNGDFDLNEFLRFTSNIDLNLGIQHLLFEAPACYYLQKYVLNITVTVKKEYTVGELNNTITSGAFGNYMMHGIFNLTKEEFKASSEMGLEGTPRKIESKLIIPLTFSNYFTPTLSIKNVISDDEFLLFLSYINTPELLNAGGGIKLCSWQFLGSLTVKTDPVPLLELTVDTPLEYIKKVRLFFNACPEDGCTSVRNYLIFNDYKMELQYSLLYKINHMLTNVHLTTPFQNFDKFLIDFEYINLEKKGIKAKFFYPLLQEPVGIELGFVLRSFLDTDVILYYNLPINENYKKFKAIVLSALVQGNYIGEISFESNSCKIGAATKNLLSNNDVDSVSVLYLWNKDINVLIGASNRQEKHVVLNINSVHDGVTTDVLNFAVLANNNYEVSTDLSIYSKKYVLAKLILTNGSAVFETYNIWRSILLSYTFVVEPARKDVHALICWDLQNRVNSQIGFRYAISKSNLSSYIAIPKLKLTYDHDFKLNDEDINNKGIDFALVSTCSLFWINKTVLGFDTFYKGQLVVEKKYYTQHVGLTLLFPEKSIKYVNEMEAFNVLGNSTDYSEMEVYDKHVIFWDALKDLQNNITIYSYSCMDKIILGMLHPKLDHKIEVRLLRYSKLQSMKNPYSLQFELEYSVDPRDLLVIDYYHLESIENEKTFESGLEVRHLSSNIYHGFSFNATLTDEITQYYLNLKYDNPQDDTQNHIRLLGKIHRSKPMLEGFIENDLNKLSGIFMTWSKNSTRGLVMQAMSNTNLPLIFKASLNSGQNDPSINFNIVAGPSKSYNIYGAIPSNKEIVAYLEHDLYGSLSKDASFNLRLNTSTLLWTKIYWKTGIWKEIRDNILNEYDDLQYIVENIGQSFVALIPDNAGEKLYKDMNLITSNMTTDFDASYLQMYYEPSLEIFKNIYQNNDLYSHTIADYIGRKV